MRFEKIKDDILGKEYSLSIAYVSVEKSREINKKYRKKDKPTNVLSFSLRKNEGELLLCRDVIKKEAKKMDGKFEDWLGFLVIHGMLHLKGMRHGSTMERAEKEFCKKYYEKYFYRHRYRNKDDTSRGGRVPKRRKTRSTGYPPERIIRAGLRSFGRES